MKRTLTILTILTVLSSCDPIYVGELRNNTDSDIEIEICGSDLSYVNNDNSGTEIPMVDTFSNCKIIKLDKGKAMPIATASGIAEPISYNDLGFQRLEIRTSNGQISATGQAIMNLFEIEEKSNFIGIHAYDLYVIDIKSKEKE